MAQIKIHKENVTRKAKSMNCLFSAVLPSILNRIMQKKSAAEIWKYLEKEYRGNEMLDNMQVMNLICEFETQRMKESETTKEYADRLLDIANKVRLFGKDFSDERIIQKILALEQRRLMRNEVFVEGVYQAHSRTGDGKLTQRTRNTKNYPPCPHCKKTNHPQQRCWWRPDVQCNKCGQLGHIEIVCKGKLQEEVEAKTIVDENQEEHLFVASCVATDNSEG
ncbi:uncharacterized protein LOC122723876 [Manihot esculenta]|uniref:uncharacterized protein LOC122723876 n=1 Tax=Manihot esculenta TaxID=3983 RepID=UPI001CC64856|nr:uncharacterized protein LOC122723876 [Manihot esculenta]